VWTFGAPGGNFFKPTRAIDAGNDKLKHFILLLHETTAFYGQNRILMFPRKGRMSKRWSDNFPGIMKEIRDSRRRIIALVGATWPLIFWRGAAILLLSRIE
jgi:hypothetical protein